MATRSRRPGAQISKLIPRDDDPPAIAGRVLIYIRPVDGVLRTCARFSNGIVVVIL